MHAERGRESITRLMKLTAGHDINHIRQIEACLDAQSKSRPARSGRQKKKRPPKAKAAGM
jgi:hypothetical protein